MFTITTCHPTYRQRLTTCLSLPFSYQSIMSAKHIRVPSPLGHCSLFSYMAPILTAMETALTNIKLCVKEARPLTPQEWEELGVIQLNESLRDLWASDRWTDVAIQFENFVYGPLFDKLSEVRRNGRDLDGAALSFGSALYPTELLSPYAQIGRLAVNRFVHVMREAGRTKEEVKRFKRIAKDNIHSIIMDVGAHAGISLIGIHWMDNNAQLDYIKRHETHPARIARGGASLTLADWYLKNHAEPKAPIDYGLDTDD